MTACVTAKLQFMRENYKNIQFNINHGKNKYCLDLVMILQISADAKELCKLCLFAVEPLKNSPTKILVKKLYKYLTLNMKE